MSGPSTKELRDGFTSYFANAGHTVVASAPLIPANDPTLMFTNAGMVQFKDVFTGAAETNFTRATSAQKVLRVSGKHNDLEEVGRTARHHTFFEMLGNFSFGDYFKAEAIELAWNYVTKEVALPPKRIWVTVFGGDDTFAADTEAKGLWQRIAGLQSDRIVERGAKDNFWSMGDRGPCGPCTEIHIDTGEGPVNEDDFENGRLLEFWNLVFMQFERVEGGRLNNLPKPSVDTGMGLERLAALLSRADSTFHTDAFLPLIELTAELAGKHYQRSDSEDDVSIRVIADHARASAFLVADGVQPANSDRGYVMRRIMRRAIRHGRRLGFNEPFFHTICLAVVDEMGRSYPELLEGQALIGKVAQAEEINFRRTLDTGLHLLDEAMAEAEVSGELSGDRVFELYDTYGFPKDLTETIARERGLTIDEAVFDRLMSAQRARSRNSQLGDVAIEGVYKRLASEFPSQRFVGYDSEATPLTERDGNWRIANGVLQLRTEVKALLRNGERFDTLSAGDVEVVLDPVPFYGESGGQVGDVGVIEDAQMLLRIDDTQKPVNGLTVAHGELITGQLHVGDLVWAGYDIERRSQIRIHHSATHLVHAALRKTLGDHVRQAGSRNTSERLRFDFSHFEATTDAELEAIEDDSNRRVADDTPVSTEVLPLAEAKQKGAIALFGEKYGEQVRVVTMGDSVEFCGGTHCERSGEIDLIIIAREDAVASGVRRVEAVAGKAARHHLEETAEKLTVAAELLAFKTVDSSLIGDDATLRGLDKFVRRYRELVSSRPNPTETSEKDAMTWASRDPTPSTLPRNATFEDAKRLRNRWVKLGQLIRLNPAALNNLVLEQDDPCGLFPRLIEVAKAIVELDREATTRKTQSIAELAASLAAEAESVNGIPLVTAKLAGVDASELRRLADSIRDRLEPVVVVLGGGSEDKVVLIAAVTPKLTGRVQAHAIIKELSPLINGRGGGKADFAQAGGGHRPGLDDAFARAREIIGQ